MIYFVCPSSIFLTTKGYRSVEELHSGDEIIDIEGHRTKITHYEIYKIQSTYFKLTAYKMRIPLILGKNLSVLTLDNIIQHKKISSLKKLDEIIIPSENYKIHSSKPNILINNKSIYNNEILRLFGYYIADGTHSGRKITLSFNATEKRFVDDVIKIFNDSLGLKCSFFFEKKYNVKRVIIYNSVLSDLFKKMFGAGSLMRRIPEYLYNLPIGKLINIVIGMVRGDGCFSVDKRGNGLVVSYTTISKELAFQLFSIFVKMGFQPSLNKRKRKGKKMVYEVFLYGQCAKKLQTIVKKKEIVIGGDLNRTISKRSNEFMFTKIRKIQKINGIKKFIKIVVGSNNPISINFIAVLGIK